MSRLLLAAILVLAAALRFAGIGWGLRHEPHSDERVFVENAAAMAAAGDLDHRYYEYPGLFFHLLAPVLRMAGEVPEPGVRGYLAARALVDAFGVLDVALAYLLGRAVAGPVVGLLAALFLAVSPLDVFTAQTARPDIVVQAFVTMALLATLGVGTRLGHDAKTGLAVGLAAAVKFSGALAFVPFAVRRLTTAGPRLKGLVIAAACAAAVLGLAMAPAIGNTAAAGSGLRDQWGYHFGAGIGRYIGGIAAFFLGVLWEHLGPFFCALILVGAIVGLRQDRSRVLPLVVLVVTTFAVHSLAHARFLRFLVPATAALCVLAALGAVSASRRLRASPAALGLLAAAIPLFHSVQEAQRVLSPHPWDRIAGALEDRVAPGAVVFVDAPGFGADRSRYRVVEASGDPGLDRWALRHADAAVLRERSSGLAAPLAIAAEVIDSTQAVPWTQLALLPASGRPEYRPVAADGGSTASAAPGQRRSEIAFAVPRTIGRVRTGLRRIPADGRFSLWFSPDAEGDTWRSIPAVIVPGGALAGGGRIEPAFLFEPLTARRIRLRAALGPRRPPPPIFADEPLLRRD